MSIRNNPQVTDEGLVGAALQGSLRVLDCRGCPGVSAAAAWAPFTPPSAHHELQAFASDQPSPRPPRPLPVPAVGGVAPPSLSLEEAASALPVLAAHKLHLVVDSGIAQTWQRTVRSSIVQLKALCRWMASQDATTADALSCPDPSSAEGWAKGLAALAHSLSGRTARYLTSSARHLQLPVKGTKAELSIRLGTFLWRVGATGCALAEALVDECAILPTLKAEGLLSWSCDSPCIPRCLPSFLRCMQEAWALLQSGKGVAPLAALAWPSAQQFVENGAVDRRTSHDWSSALAWEVSEGPPQGVSVRQAPADSGTGAAPHATDTPRGHISSSSRRSASSVSRRLDFDDDAGGPKGQMNEAPAVPVPSPQTVAGKALVRTTTMRAFMKSLLVQPAVQAPTTRIPSRHTGRPPSSPAETPRRVRRGVGLVRSSSSRRAAAMLSASGPHAPAQVSQRARARELPAATPAATPKTAPSRGPKHLPAGSLLSVTKSLFRSPEEGLRTPMAMGGRKRPRDADASIQRQRGKTSRSANSATWAPSLAEARGRLGRAQHTVSLDQHRRLLAGSPVYGALLSLQARVKAINVKGAALAASARLSAAGVRDPAAWKARLLKAVPFTALMLAKLLMLREPLLSACGAMQSGAPREVQELYEQLFAEYSRAKQHLGQHDMLPAFK